MAQELDTTVCIAGGGPAGIVAGLILARAGIDVVVLEKHADFLRDFRGDTVHPSTLNLLDQLGLSETAAAIVHSELSVLDAVIDGIRLHAVDFTTLPGPHRYVTLMPQWDLLTMLVEEAQRQPSFRLVLEATAHSEIQENGRVVGIEASTPDGPLRVNAVLSVAADGRASAVRDALGLVPADYGVPIDVLWFRVPRPTKPMRDTLANIRGGSALVTIPRPGYFQCGLLIRKGSFPEFQSAGIEAFRDTIARTAPRLSEVTREIASFDDVKLLSVQINRLHDWSVPGAICIGDAAHAMSPAFGVGINYAIQDAVALANTLVPVLRKRGTDAAAIDAACAAVQRRRTLPTALMQRMQRVAHRLINRATSGIVLHNPPRPRERFVIAVVLPRVRPILARIVGYGFRPERIAAGILKPRA
ncbi:FAD-dependent oxidoreductase [Salinibacterium sp. SWN167]|uniref:FAD-dependent oxidoreductase n=1 Tax=Salinibacterium sp. SWN167 TaxID=2792054 RepID=UPI0018CDC74F|nr:FAD-dependent oxidoreductase [Salinibacterium sp. SWN167]MBH0084053.1 FAD-dependent oxidoreductase [Salinibacterium sp. SWN167]